MSARERFWRKHVGSIAVSCGVVCALSAPLYLAMYWAGLGLLATATFAATVGLVVTIAVLVGRGWLHNVEQRLVACPEYARLLHEDVYEGPWTIRFESDKSTEELERLLMPLLVKWAPTESTEEGVLRVHGRLRDGAAHFYCDCVLIGGGGASVVEVVLPPEPDSRILHGGFELFFDVVALVETVCGPPTRPVASLSDEETRFTGLLPIEPLL